MGRKPTPPRPLTDAEAERLMIYGALDNRTRLLAYEVIRARPGIPFNELARHLGVKTGLAAYHLALLKAAGLVEFRYVRRSKETSHYRLTKYGERWYRKLFGTRRTKTRPTATSRNRAASTAGG
ncbi:MAG TPA: winged helix-turn-helix domain-containing protein [Thermoplasmata archaeon]|nr:winged helix-turn-helix domain-containing protein [Thermoplasmata archaeon]